MNRSALVIKMLNYLKANDVVSREEIANYLETNKRNISEFKKELEVAGYVIESITGKDGGYRLDESTLVPTINLNDREIASLHDASAFLQMHQYNQIAVYNEALLKIKNALHEPNQSNNIHYIWSSQTTNNESQMIAKMQEGRDRHQHVRFAYRSLQAKDFETRYVQPYELIVSEDGNYVLAYDRTEKKKPGFKFFKLSEIRMKHVVVEPKRFARDPDFKIDQYVGKQNVIPEAYRVKIKVTGLHAVLLAERSVGLLETKSKVEDGLLMEFTMENKTKILEFIRSLGSDCTLLEPLELKDELITSLKETLTKYML
ncbi:hypothetical protein A4S06_02090 [Erysipelotrichaceae bacterium MTC7]|nr:hypothetical protein A4S06_02090 [Erysipelotrichaceae bacterium MTC7]